jgi:hypothetical protein
MWHAGLAGPRQRTARHDLLASLSRWQLRVALPRRTTGHTTGSPCPRLGAGCAVVIPRMRRIDGKAGGIAAGRPGLPPGPAWALAWFFLDLIIVMAAQRANVFEHVVICRIIRIRPRLDMIADQPLAGSASGHRAAPAVTTVARPLQRLPVLAVVIPVARQTLALMVLIPALDLRMSVTAGLAKAR